MTDCICEELEKRLKLPISAVIATYVPLIDTYVRQEADTEDFDEMIDQLLERDGGEFVLHHYLLL
jgi:hypothetical protein